MADHNENLKDTLNEEIEHADQKPAEEHYSLNDDRRVKVLSPGMLVGQALLPEPPGGDRYGDPRVHVCFLLYRRTDLPL